MAYNVVLSVNARKEIAKTALYYKDISFELSEDLLTLIFNKIDEIAKKPEIYQRDKTNYRKANLQRFPFKFFFRIDGNDIVILAFAHHKRAPYYFEPKNRRKS